MIHQIAIAGYRSLRHLVLKLDQLNVVAGPNGSGKSNIYRGLGLLADTANGRLVYSLAREGGLNSTLWAGPELISREMRLGQTPVQGTVRKHPVSLKLGLKAEPFSYSVDVGLPAPSTSAFAMDPEIKRECLWRGPDLLARYTCADRRKGSLRCRPHKGAWRDVEMHLPSQASMLTEYSDPLAAPELMMMREIIRSWRFYDTFRTDPESPARRLAVGTYTPVMSGDGADLAAALQTILEIGDAQTLCSTIDDAFPGSKILVESNEHGMQLYLRQPGMLRNLSAAELSDGTLRYLLLTAALLSPRPPQLLVINEPENSLHPDLIGALARLIIAASDLSQVIVVTHSDTLIARLEAAAACHVIRLQKELGETVVEGSTTLSNAWEWPGR